LPAGYERRFSASWPRECSARPAAAPRRAVRQSPSFLADFTRFQERVAAFGALTSLAQVLIKLTAPGVPDFYQGTELWDFSLVDPDNRRLVDWALRRRLLDDLVKEIDGTPDRAELARSLLRTHEDGASSST
jgi:(1->4)-alpha-D-glucan 1-alpha-D-glucosylmutase